MPVVHEGEQVVEWTPGIRWGKALLAGLIAGLILLVIPWGSPWAGTNFTTPAVMGRPVPAQMGVSYFEAAFLHLGVSTVYALIIALLVATFPPGRALLTGALAGVILYILNFVVFRTFFSAMAGPEWPVLLAHFVFGLLTTALYRGMAKRRAPNAPPSDSAP